MDPDPVGNQSARFRHPEVVAGDGRVGRNHGGSRGAGDLNACYIRSRTVGQKAADHILANRRTATPIGDRNAGVKKVSIGSGKIGRQTAAIWLKADVVANDTVIQVLDTGGTAKVHTTREIPRDHITVAISIGPNDVIVGTVTEKNPVGVIATGEDTV